MSLRRNTWITQVILPPVAICAAPVTLTANANACTDTISAADLTQAINNGSTSPGAPVTLGTTVTGALPVAGSYSLTAGQTYTVTLLATNAAGAQSSLRHCLGRWLLRELEAFKPSKCSALSIVDCLLVPWRAS